MTSFLVHMMILACGVATYILVTTVDGAGLVLFVMALAAMWVTP